MTKIPSGPGARDDHEVTRRRFLQRGALAAAALTAGTARLGAVIPESWDRSLFTLHGIAAPMPDAGVMRDAGADYIVPHAADALVPDLSDADFEAQRRAITGAPIPVLYCNVFLSRPGLHCTGPNANPDDVLAYARLLFRRLQQIGGRYMAFGSGTARRVPDGWPKAKADDQFAGLLARMAPLAAERNLVIVVEQLRTLECNYLNHLDEVVDMVGRVDRPNVRVLADLYHMRQMGDGPDTLKKAGPLVAMVEIAEKDKRSYPGVAGDDFRPFFSALRAAGYAGPITIEGNGTPPQAGTAFATIARQVREA